MLEVLRDIAEVVEVAPAEPDIWIGIVLVFLPPLFLLIGRLLRLDAFGSLLLLDQEWRVLILLVTPIAVLVRLLEEFGLLLRDDEIVLLRALLNLLRRVEIGSEGVILVVQVHILEVVQKPIIIQIVFMVLFLRWLEVLGLHSPIENGRALDVDLPHELVSKIASNIQVEVRVLPGSFDFFKIVRLLLVLVILLDRE